MPTVPTPARPEHQDLYLNPPWDKCRCTLKAARASFEDPKRLHRQLLALNGPHPLRALAEVLVLCSFGELTELHDQSVLSAFAGEHNWTDPVAITAILDGLDALGRRCHELHWLQEVASGRIVPSCDVLQRPTRRILEGLQGKCPWVLASGNEGLVQPPERRRH